MGYPSCVRTHAYENSTFPILQMWAVKIYHVQHPMLICLDQTSEWQVNVAKNCTLRFDVRQHKYITLPNHIGP